MHIIDIIVVCAAVGILLACGLILARQRFMLRAPGTVPVALRPGRTGRWQYGVARYTGPEFCWYRSLGIGTRPSRVLQRHDVTVLGSRAPGASDLASVPAKSVIVECRLRGAEVFLALGDSAYTGFVSWLESSAPMA